MAAVLAVLFGGGALAGAAIGPDHLIVARRDLTGLQHLHPEQADDGTWTTSVRLDEAGSYPPGRPTLASASHRYGALP